MLLKNNPDFLNLSRILIKKLLDEFVRDITVLRKKGTK